MRKFDKSKYYGCCACIGAAGVGIVSKAAYLTSKDGIVVNMYLDGKTVTRSPLGNRLELTVRTDYPLDGSIKLTVSPEVEERFILYLRNPVWSKNTVVSLNGKKLESPDGYIEINNLWHNGDTVELDMPMETFGIRPIHYDGQVLMNKIHWGKTHITIPSFDQSDPEAKNHMAFKRGPLMLAQDARFGNDLDEPIEPIISETGIASVELFIGQKPFNALLNAELLLKDGSKQLLCDYASAGKTWDSESKIAVWIKTIG